MKIAKLYNQHLLLLLLIIIFVIFAFRDLPQGFFEQDEWHSFGYYNYLLSLSGDKFWNQALQSGPLSHFTPLSLFVKMNMYKVFGLNAGYYFIVSIALHSLVATVLYCFIYFFLRKKIPAFLGSLFFVVNSSHHQAVTWIGTFEGTEGAVLFGLTSLLFYFLYINIRKRRLFYISIFSILIALLFKETALVFLTVLGSLILYNGKEKGYLLDIFVFAGAILVYLYLRFAYLFLGVVPSPDIIEQSTANFFKLFPYNLTTLPIKIFTQILFPNELLIELTNKATTPFNIYQHLARGPWVLENAFRYDLLTIPIGLVILVFLILLRKRIKASFPLDLGLVLIIFTLLPLLFLKKYIVYLDSRYLYPATIGFSLIVAVTINNISIGRTYLKVKKSLFGIFSFPVYVCIFITVIFGLHMFILDRVIKQKIDIGIIRWSLLTQISLKYPSLPAKVIFFTESNKSYYGLSAEDKIMPFQEGFGHTLMVWYYPFSEYPASFFKEDFLWEIDSQGYKEFNGRGFGYFRDFSLLKKEIKKYKIPINSIIAFSWDDKTKSLVDTSYEIRQLLKDNLQ